MKCRSKDRVKIKDIKNPTFEQCLKIVEEKPTLLKYIDIQTEEMCLEVVKKSPRSIQYVKEISPSICFEALIRNPQLFTRVRFDFSMNRIVDVLKKQSYDFWKQAIIRNGMVLEAFNKFTYYPQSEELCLIAVKNNGLALEFVKNQTDDICFEAVKRNSMAIKYVKNQTKDLCLSAFCS